LVCGFSQPPNFLPLTEVFLWANYPPCPLPITWSRFQYFLFPVLTWSRVLGDTIRPMVSSTLSFFARTFWFRAQFFVTFPLNLAVVPLFFKTPDFFVVFSGLQYLFLPHLVSEMYSFFPLCCVYNRPGPPARSFSFSLSSPIFLTSTQAWFFSFLCSTGRFSS